MDVLSALLAGDDDDGEGPPSAYDDERDNIEIDVGEPEEEEEEEEENMEYRPVKRSRSAAAAVSPDVPGDEGGRRRGGSGAGASSGRLNDHEESKEVIEILSDDEDAQPPPARSELFEDDMRNRLSANLEVDAPVAAAPLFEDEFSNHVVGATAADLRSRMPAGGGAARSIERAGAGRDPRGGLKGGVKIGFSMMASSVAARSHDQEMQQTAAAATDHGGAPAAAAGRGDIDVVMGEGKPSVEEKEASTPASNGSAGWLGGVVAAAKAAVTSTINPTSDGDVGIGGSTAAAAAAAAASQELPRILECAVCFNPLAVAALFACGHGSCWECAHDWCSRETSSTMDCPTCHVSVPRSDFRRCVVLDEVVDRAVTAAGMDDDEWRARVERGQKLAREAEGRRRSLRDAQRSAEDTIAEQAAELEKLREEAKSRRVGRRALRAQEGSTSSMAEFGFGVLNGGNLTGGRRRDFFDPASQRSAVEEYTRRRVEEAAAAAGSASSSRQARVAAAGEAAAVAAAAFGMPPSAAYGVVGPRGHAHRHPLSAAAAAAGSSGFGHAEGDPWFSLRPSQPSRGATGAMAPGRRMARETAGRSGSSGRSAGNSAAAAAAMGLGQPAAAALKSVHGHGRAGGGGTNWRSSAYLHPGRSSLSGGAGGSGGGGRTRLHGSSARADPRGGTDVNVGSAAAGTPLDGGNLTNPVGGPGRSFTVQVPARSIRKTHGLSGLHGGGASASGGHAGSAAAVVGTSTSYPNPLANGLGLAPPPSSSPSLHYSSSGGSQPSRGGGGDGLPFGGRTHGRAAAAAAAAAVAPSPAPMLDLGDLMAGHDDASSRSEWDDVLASISTPMQATDDARSNSPGATRG
ncbi:unnamed protein product [Ectocarpus sp. CCAP 1310/34]|nr:unnamed protein product [Ectocarpus sp. CCAP 1310/34]